MSSPNGTILTFLLINYWSLVNPLFAIQNQDTAYINSKSREALAIARRNPDMSISLAHLAMSASYKLKYSRGIADASCALGMAYLTKYNLNDSATYYNHKALKLYNTLNDPRGKALACYGLTYVYSFNGDLEESEKYGNLSLRFFEQAGDKRGMVNAYSALSYLAKQKKDLPEARELIENAIQISRSVNDTIPLADALNSLGNIYKDLALFNQAIDTYFEALQLWELKGDSNGIAIAYGSIGLMYYFQKNWSKALEYNFRKMPLSETAGDLWELSKTYNTIAQIYNAKAEYDSSLLFIRKSLALNKKMNFQSGIASAYEILANTFLLNKNIDSAYFYINQAVTLAKKINDPSLVNYYVTLGNVQKVKGNYQLALKNTLEAHYIAKERNLTILLSDVTILLSDIYSLTDRYDLAYIYLKEHMLLQDSLSSDEFRNKVSRLEIQYEFDKKQRAAEFAQMEERIISENKINQQRQYLKGLGILIILLALIFLLFLRHNQLRAMYSRIDLEQRLLRAQMNPHFIFNSLCAVQDFILADKPQKANTFLTKIARLMRNILENSRQEFIPLEKEIETLRLYLDVQQLRFETEFKYSISVEKSIDPENYAVPPMLTQPVVENSIEHGLLPNLIQGELEINFSLLNGLIKIIVTDNGIGRSHSSDISSSGNKQSVSTKLITQRLKNFRKTFREKKISYEIIDLFTNGKASGTKVIMIIPFRKIYT